MNFARRVWTNYSALLQEGGWKSLSAKSLTSAAIAGGGDVACQLLIEERKWSSSFKSEKMDLVRTFRFSLLGGIYIAPALHLWYGYLGRSIQGSGFYPVLKRLALDQLVFAPTFIGSFFCVLGVCEGKSQQQIQEQLRKEWAVTVVTNWNLWIPAQLINFSLVPGHLQVIVFWLCCFFFVQVCLQRDTEHTQANCPAGRSSSPTPSD